MELMVPKIVKFSRSQSMDNGGQSQPPLAALNGRSQPPAAPNGSSKSGPCAPHHAYGRSKSGPSSPPPAIGSSKSGPSSPPHTNGRSKSGPSSPSSPPADKELRIVVLGTRGVGKSALVVRYLTKRFIGEYAHQERVCVKYTMIDGKPAKLHILDTSVADDDDLPPLQKEHLAWADGFLLVYSISDLSSFYAVRSLLDSIHDRTLIDTGTTQQQNAVHPNSQNSQNSQNSTSTSSNISSAPVPCVLVANKVDLPPEARKIPELEGRRCATHLGCPYVESSAQESYSTVVQAFTLLIHEIRTQQKRERLSKITKKSHSTISQLRETLRSLTDFRTRTHTF